MSPAPWNREEPVYEGMQNSLDQHKPDLANGTLILERARAVQYTCNIGSPYRDMVGAALGSSSALTRSLARVPSGFHPRRASLTAQNLAAIGGRGNSGSPVETEHAHPTGYCWRR
jgi:hypothetical protein